MAALNSYKQALGRSVTDETFIRATWTITADTWPLYQLPEGRWHVAVLEQRVRGPMNDRALEEAAFLVAVW